MHKDCLAEYQSERQINNAQMADIIYMKKLMIDDYYEERSRRQKNLR